MLWYKSEARNSRSKWRCGSGGPRHLGYLSFVHGRAHAWRGAYSALGIIPACGVALFSVPCGGRGMPVMDIPGLFALHGREIRAAVDPLDLGLTAVAVRAGAGAGAVSFLPPLAPEARWAL